MISGCHRPKWPEVGVRPSRSGTQEWRANVGRQTVTDASELCTPADASWNSFVEPSALTNARNVWCSLIQRRTRKPCSESTRLAQQYASFHSTPCHRLPYHRLPYTVCHVTFNLPYHRLQFYRLSFHCTVCHTTVCHATVCHSTPFHQTLQFSPPVS